MRDSGATGCIIKQDLVIPRQYTGEKIDLIKIDGTEVVVPAAEIDVDTPFFQGKVKAAVLEQPIYDLIIGNIPGVRNCASTDVGTQTVAAVVTRQAAQRELQRVKPLTVMSISHVINRKEVKEEQRTDPTLARLHELKEEGAVKRNKKGVESKFVSERGRLYRQVASPGGRVQM